MSDNDGSITQRLDDFKRGNDDALRPLMERFLTRLEDLAQKKIRAAGGHFAVGDGADAANSAFRMLWQGVRDERFSKLDNRADLWTVLVHLAGCKVVDMLRAEATDKRGGGKVRRESDHLDPESRSLFEQMLRKEPGPEQLAIFEEEIARRLAMLKEPILRQIAQLDLEDYTDQEIADRVGVHKRTVSLKLEIIRKLWREGEKPILSGQPSRKTTH